MESTRLSKNKQGYGYKYTELAQINEYCEQNDIRYYQYIDRIEQDDYVMTVINQNGKDSEPRRGSRVVQATLNGIKNPAQEQGSALTYARRYSLLMALGLATEDDDGVSLTKDKDSKQDNTNYKELVEKYLADNNLDKKEFCVKYKLNAKSTQSDFKKIYESLGNK